MDYWYMLKVNERWWVANHIFGCAAIHECFRCFSCLDIMPSKCVTVWPIPFLKQFWRRFVISPLVWHVLLVRRFDFGLTIFGQFSFMSQAAPVQMTNFTAIIIPLLPCLALFFSWPATSSKPAQCLNQMSRIILFHLVVHFLFDTNSLVSVNEHRGYVYLCFILFFHHT